MSKVVLELTESEIAKLHPELTDKIKLLDRDVVAHMLAAYILHKNGSGYKNILNELTGLCIKKWRARRCSNTTYLKDY